MKVVASLSQGRTAAAQCGLLTYKSVPVIFEPPCIFELPSVQTYVNIMIHRRIYIGVYLITSNSRLV